jgi:hypothetical protein
MIGVTGGSVCDDKNGRRILLEMYAGEGVYKLPRLRDTRLRDLRPV